MLEKDILKCCFLGDSMTEGIGTSEPYYKHMQVWLGQTNYVYGKDGAQSCDLMRQIEEMEGQTSGDFDAVFIMIGTNDFVGGVPLGEFFTEHMEKVAVEYDKDNQPVRYEMRKKREFSFNENTFKGRMNKALYYLKENYSDKEIILITQPHRGYAYFGGENVQPDELYANKIGEYFDTYIEAVRKLADIFAVGLIDAYRDSGLFPLATKNADRYFNLEKQDSLHPNAAGHKKIAWLCTEYLKWKGAKR